MCKVLRLTLLLTAITAPLYAQSWSFGAGAGPFIFGKFFSRTTVLVTEQGSAKTRSTLSAATRRGGAQWWWSDRFAAEGRVQDVVTSSPFERSDFGTLSGIHTLRPQHVHTTVGIRYRF